MGPPISESGAIGFRPEAEREEAAGSRSVPLANTDGCALTATAKIAWQCYTGIGIAVEVANCSAIKGGRVCLIMTADRF